jgi:formylglycine-generating enzyme required for sulfatase activity
LRVIEDSQIHNIFSEGEKMKKTILACLFVFCVFLSSRLFAKPVSVDQARKAAATMVKAETKRMSKMAINLAQEIEKQTTQKQYVLTDTKEIRGNNGELLAYVTELEPEGFIITSADDKIRPILGYSFKGRFPFQDSKQNVLLHLVQWDVQARNKAMKSQSNEIKTLAKTNSDLWNNYSIAENGLLGTLSDATQWPDPDQYGYEGWIKTNWFQGDYYADPWTWVETHYDNKCPLLMPGHARRCKVGCTATAMAQILNYWKYPASVSFNNLPWPLGDSYTSKGDAGHFSIDNDADERDFPAFSTLNTALSSINYNGDQEEEAYLCFAVGIKVQMDYGSQSGAWLDGSAYREGFDYGSAVRPYFLSGSVWSTYESKVIENIKEGCPVQIGIRQSGEKGGHSIIIDGYNETTEEFHCNFGWSDSNYNFWYNIPDFYPTSYDLVDDIVYDICPYQGWNQWGADEKNSFSTTYVAPTTDPPINKWYRTCSSGYSFEGLVVGTGNRIYASSVPDTQGNHPSIWVINQYGEKEKEITINEEIDGLTYPVQNSKGEVFVGADSGKVYRINPKDNSYDLIFTADAQLYKPPKVDSDGRIYVCTLYKLYCLSRTGYKYWEFPTPNTNYSFFRKVPAIDVARNRVYIDYYNPSTDIAYLVCINRLTGLEIESCRKSVASITSGFYSFSTPSIGPDGTVYSGCKTSLYAFNPDATLSQKWAHDLVYTYVNTSPTVGPTGTLYTSHWVNLGGGNYNLRIGARDASNGNLKWEYSHGTSNICDSIGDIYISGNNVVSFWYNSNDCSSSPSTHTIYALRDNGASYEHLWEKDFGQQGGQTAFGPGATLYTISSTLAGNTIYALSEGAVGDPDGGGMGFTDNAAPAMPFNPSPIDEANNIGSTVTLSWACSDPEAHTLKYSLFVGESGYDMVPVATDITGTSYELTELKLGTGYAWKIIATDGQAISESPTWVFATEPPNADLNGDYFVNFKDFAILAFHWLETCSGPNYCDGADYYHDGQVDSKDLSYLCENWLEGVEVPVHPEPNGMVWVSINEPNFTGYMSKYETTNAQYCQFLNAANASNQITVYNNVVYATSDTSHSQPYYDLAGAGYTHNGATNGGAARINYTGGVFSVKVIGFDNHPVTYVSWYGSTAFCNYYGYRLPTEWEWRAVADYDGTYTYGCGTSINNGIANYLGSTHPNGTTVVGSIGDPSGYGYGMADMAGNVWEWTSSCYYSDCSDGARVVSGGSWVNLDIYCVVLYRTYGNHPYDASYDYGFRVCR